jgi:hypothetical protein
MAKVLPFHGLLPTPEKAAQVAAVPVCDILIKNIC